jgi:hypothetical protein
MANVRRLPPVEAITDGPYELKLLKAPSLQGWALRAFISLYESGLGGSIFASISAQSGVKQVPDNHGMVALAVQDAVDHEANDETSLIRLSSMRFFNEDDISVGTVETPACRGVMLCAMHMRP